MRRRRARARVELAGGRAVAGERRLLFETPLEVPNVSDVRSNFALRTIKAAGPLPLPGR